MRAIFTNRVFIIFLGFLVSSSPVIAANYYVENGTIYRDGQQIHLYGVTWFGFELKDHIVYGLDQRNWKEIIDDIKKLGFNAIRLPFCSESIKPQTIPNPDKIDYKLNPDLKNLTSIEVMEKIISYSNKLGIYILLDYHRIGCTEIEPLWYTSNYSEEQYIEDWILLAEKFANIPMLLEQI